MQANITVAHCDLKLILRLIIVWTQYYLKHCHCLEANINTACCGLQPCYEVRLSFKMILLYMSSFAGQYYHIVVCRQHYTVLLLFVINIAQFDLCLGLISLNVLLFAVNVMWSVHSSSIDASPAVKLFAAIVFCHQFVLLSPVGMGYDSFPLSP